MSLGNNERRMLRAMLSDASRTWNLTDLLEATGWSDQVHIAGAGTGLAEAGLHVESHRPSRSNWLVGSGPYRRGRNRFGRGGFSRDF